VEDGTHACREISIDATRPSLRRLTEFLSGVRTKNGKKALVPHAEKSAAEVVLYEELAGRAEAADLSHAFRPGGSLCAEKFPWFVLFQVVMPVILTIRAVLPAELPVLFGIGYRGVA